MIKDRAMQIGAVRNCDYKILLTKDQGEVITNLIKWLINDPSGELDLAKGFWLFGKPGVFKTEFVRLMQDFSENNKLTKAFRYTDWSMEYDIALMDNKGGDIIQVNQMFNRCFDEFGRKTMPINRFGNKVDANEAIIESRYVRFKRYRQITCFVSNYHPASIQKILSEMAFDRIREMVKSIEMPGESYRKL